MVNNFRTCIQDAQEKFALQQEGDRLDATVRRAQRDIASLENTLKVMHASNKAYKRSLENVEEGGNNDKFPFSLTA